MLPPGGLLEPVVARYTRQLLQGLAYLHQNRVMHRDIKVCAQPVTARCSALCQQCRPLLP